MENYQEQGFFRRHAVWMVVILAIVVFGFFLAKGWGKAVNDQIETMSTVTGNFSCLPLKSGAETSKTNCTLGVRSKDGSFYALDISHIQDANTDLKAEDTIAVTGFLEPESEVAGSAWAVYDVKGIIKVNTLLRTR